MGNGVYQYLMAIPQEMYSHVSTNNTISGKITLFSINVTAETALHPNGQYIFSTNNLGSWVNDSAVNFTTTPSWANVTKILNLTAETIVGYRWYFNDTVGNTNSTPIYELTTTDGTHPRISIVSPTSGQTFTTSTASFEVRTNENSTCNYSINSGATNYSMTANATNTGFTASKTLSNGDYYVANYYCSNIYGNLNNTESAFFSVSVSSTASSTGGLTYKPTSKQIQEGYEQTLREGQKVKINLSNGENYTVVVGEVNKIQKKVIVNISGSNYSIAENFYVKIDLNNDGYYDLNIFVIHVYNNNYAKIGFKEIHEEIPAENKEAGTGNTVNNSENSVNNKSKLIYYILGVAVLILIIGIIFKKVKKKKRYKKFGY